jgi:hypothetical protein
MRYKNNALDKITQIEASLQRLQFQVNRGMEQEQILESIETTKGNLENLREIISIEDDEFRQQFRPQ